VDGRQQAASSKQQARGGRDRPGQQGPDDDQRAPHHLHDVDQGGDEVDGGLQRGAGDWKMFDGLATTLIQGPTDDPVIQVTEMFPPLIVLVDEAQVAFMCPAKDDEKRPYGGSPGQLPVLHGRS
jgi:hypothetical protein